MPQTAFAARKEKILQQLNVPLDEYNDASPKGSVDEGIRSLIADINEIDGLVTTSSCAGRVSIYLDGGSSFESAPDSTAPDVIPSSSASGGKGGGQWLFVSHDPLEMPSLDNASQDHFHSLFGLRTQGQEPEGTGRPKRFIHFKFEAMILHVATASLNDAQRALSAALSAGFRESGAVTLNPGYEVGPSQYLSIVDESYLHTIVGLANDRFRVNKERIERFRAALVQLYRPTVPASQSDESGKPAWEDPEDRKRRKKEEGLKRQAEIRAQRADVDDDAGADSSLETDGVFSP